MLIFTNETGNVANGGVPAHPLRESQEAIELKKRGNGAAFQRLPDTELSLATARSLLEQSGTYKVVEHVAWQQPGLSEDASRSVRIRGGVDYQYTPVKTPLLGQVYENEKFRTAPPEPTTLRQLDGTVTVALNKYLHVHTNFVLRKTVEAPTASIAQRLRSARGLYQYRIRQHRRMRSRQLHYFDHPLLGILVLISPIQPEPSDQQSEPDRLERTPTREQKTEGRISNVAGHR